MSKIGAGKSPGGLFIGDVGRPDLVNIGDSSTIDLARDVSLDPRHAPCAAGPGDRHARPRAGSSCGKNLSTQLTSTIGEQRRTNPSVQPMSEGDFVDLITHGQPAAPSYFSVDAAMNKRVHPLLDQHRKIPHGLRLRSARRSTTAYGWWMPAASTTSRPDVCGLDQRRRDRRPPG
jgi:hypothetical protein